MIRVVDRGKLRSTPFLDIHSQVTNSGEQGLLSVAFNPQYKQNRRFYVQYTDRNGSTQVVEYRSNGTRAIPGSARQLFFSRDPYANHNGGQLVFGRNGRLYFTMGDGGSGGDPENRAQNMRSRFGKLLSLNVATKGVRIEALGLRNAWRFSFDRANGDLYIGDVGQGAIEEIDYTPRIESRARELRLGRLRGRLEVRGQGRPARASSSSRSRSTATATAARSRVASSTAARDRVAARAATSSGTTAAGRLEPAS